MSEQLGLHSKMLSKRKEEGDIEVKMANRNLPLQCDAEINLGWRENGVGQSLRHLDELQRIN